MNYAIELGRMAEKAIRRGLINDDELRAIIGDFLDKFEGVDVNIEFKKLAGKWAGFYRIRKRDLRIIARVDFDGRRVFVDRIDDRKDVYK